MRLRNRRNRQFAAPSSFSRLEMVGRFQDTVLDFDAGGLAHQLSHDAVKLPVRHRGAFRRNLARFC